MRTLFSYLLLICLALSGFSGSVQTAHASTLADALVQHQLNTDVDSLPPCHGAPEQTEQADHDCCKQDMQSCKDNCCQKHCAASGALLTAELFRYIRPQRDQSRHSERLPQWLFVKDPPPPINA